MVNAAHIAEFGARAVARCIEMRRPPFSEALDLLDRPYLTGAHEAALRRIELWMAAAGMIVRRDALATLIGRYEARTPGAPALLIGSHVDSVRDGGAFDGMLGVLLGLACVETLAAQGKRLSFAIEVLGFGDEEGSRFPAAMNASRAMTGALHADALSVTDRAGVSIAQALTAFGADAPISTAKRERETILGFLEPHIEQGPALEAAGKALGVVTAIAGQVRLRVALSGQAGHAGTTPMGMRRDALAAAGEIILAVERIGAAGPGDLVATVGRIEAQPGAPNVIAGSALITVDARAGADTLRDNAVRAITQAIEAIAARRGVRAEITFVQSLAATPMDVHLSEHLARACELAGEEPLRLTSGAGHDAMIFAPFAPTAMLFIRCAQGISHNPAESVTAEDGARALSALCAFVDRLEQERTS